MTRQEEIKTLESLKGDTYFAQMFGKDIDKMIENVKNDYQITTGTIIEAEHDALMKVIANLKDEIAENVKKISALEKDLSRKDIECSDRIDEEMREMVLDLMGKADYEQYEYLAEEFDDVFALRCKFKREGCLEDDDIEKLFNLAESLLW